MPEERVRRQVRRGAVTPAPLRFRGDGGAIIVEAAFLTPLFVLFIFGILEFGSAFRDYLTLNNATGAGAREASIAANNEGADYEIVQAIKSASVALPSSEILHIVVFHPSAPDGVPTASCKAGNPSVGTGGSSFTDACNTYTSTAFGWSSTSLNWGCGATAADRYWCPTARNYALTGAHSPPDYVGVYIQVLHPYITGLFGSSILMAKTSVIKIEPQSLQ